MKRAGTCGHCGKAGHYRPTCPERTATRAPASPSPSSAGVADLPAPGPWSLVASLHDDVHLLLGRWTWAHTDGTRVTAQVKLVPVAESLELPPEEFWRTRLILRHPRDVFAYLARTLPDATVTVTRPEEIEPAPVGAFAREAITDARAWGMW